MKKIIYPLILISLIGITLIGGWIAYDKAAYISNVTAEQMSRSFSNSQNIIQLSKILSDIAYKDFSLYNNNALTPQYIQGLKEEISSDLRTMEKIIPLVSFESNDIQSVWGDFKNYFVSLKSDFLKTDITDIISFMQRDLKTLIDYTSTQMSKTKSSILKNLNAVKKEIAFALPIVAAVEMVIVLLLFFKAFKPLIKLISKLQILSSGDLRCEFNLKHYGIFKDVTKNLTSFKNKINSFLTRTKEISSSIKENSRKIAEGNNVFWNKINEISENEEKISEITQNMKEQTTDLLDNTQRSLELVNEAMGLVNGTNSLMQKTGAAVKEMFVNSKKLEEVFKFIDEIAMQTDILAINASVEASKAGKYGKVFSIIARDIRNLSMQTAKYSEESKKLVNANMENINRVKEFSEQVLSSFEDARNNFYKLIKEVKIIGQAIPEQHEKITQVSDSINQITEILREYVKGVKSLADVGKELSQESEALVFISKEFKLQDENE